MQRRTLRLSKYLVWPLTLGLVACGNRLDTAEVESAIQADIERQGRRLSLKAVLCPGDVSRQAEAYFRCVGEVDGGGTFTINVIQQDNQGNITWEVPNSKALLNLPKVEDSIQQGLSQAHGKRALIDCGSATYRVNQPGDRFECQVVGGVTTDTRTITAVVVSIDPDGDLSWQEQTAAPGTSLQAIAAPGNPSPAGTAAPQAKAPAAAAPTAGPKSTAVTGPTGRTVNRPYVQGDDD
ncbi:DUF4333 domain-containing protein [Phormidium sp. FACHB-322]|uniref:DUF4333 domain-containing protein n=1 Tax=Cyanophyceae TaxID=3028117 RepID=UPI0016872B99|nr:MULTISPECIES: DUF4333 domain-containing protein [Cyanophyceae]MBD2032621.1 DUF4333 domain-containing protein [Phormidium sp. FACHB-322]MBD2049993.1 DUF4333 domain-containing protein [Leptolyngbya sp. FACHB-60]